MDFFYGLSEWAEILRGFHEILNQADAEISAVYLDKQKSFIPKKSVNRFQYQNNQLCLLTNFLREDFDDAHLFVAINLAQDSRKASSVK